MYGEVDHGFYHFNPTFFWDLIYANKYQNIFLAKCTTKDITFYRDRKSCSDDIQSMDKTKVYGIWSIYKKIYNSDFKIPMQGVYDENLKNKDLLRDYWKEQRGVTDSNS